jgi:hypothetical protein
MSTPANRYSTPQSREKIARIEALMRERPHVTVSILMEECDMGEVSAGDYLRQMQREGLVHLIERARTYQNGSYPALWKIGPAPEGHRVEGLIDIPQRVIVRKVWSGPVPSMFEPKAFLYGRAA